jgi:hypothetical protein
MTQPDPIENDLVEIADLVLIDMAERKRIGMERYGVPLQPFNGRSALWDAYEEVLDLAVYLRQQIEEDRITRAPRVSQGTARV